MRLTRSAVLSQRQGSHNHLEPSPSTTIDILPEDVLLEIFDSYRQAFEQEPRYERIWNSNNGWFKLAHVCRRWRCVVLESSSRLHLRLVLTSCRPPRAVMLTRLPPLPIIVDHSGATIQEWKEENRAATALLRYPNRTCGITIKRSYLLSDVSWVCMAMNRPLPILESFKLLNDSGYEYEFKVPTTIFKGSAPSLRRLQLQCVLFASVSQLLSSTTGLVELDLDIDTIVSLSPAASLLTHLQGMPCLRHLQLRVLRLPSPTIYIPVLPVGAADVVPLLRLTHLRFSGSTTCFEALAAGLAAPFLQDLEIELNYYSHAFPHLSRFIGDVDGLFFAVLVDITSSAPRISMLTHSHSIDEPPRRIAIKNGMTWSAPICTAFGARLTTVEQLFFQWSWVYCNEAPYRQFHQDPIAWRRFFEQFQNLKILRVGRELLLNVARFLSLNSGEPPLPLLPALEEIELRSAVAAQSVAPPIGNIEREEVLSTLGPFIAARQQAGRPVRISWNADPALPSPYW
ncbi:hypothetical protein BJV78DRAFT_1351515 [Lactifluus subvellereus]|nr:hypothetical protein BJV78DRAFT_1351515 [Lactifluus subvellereus]